MLDIFSEPEARIVVGITVVLIASAVLVYVVLKIRGHAEQGMPGADEYLTTFREMYEQGALNENEFRRVKSELREALQQQFPSANDEEKRPDSSTNPAVESLHNQHDAGDFDTQADCDTKSRTD